MQTLTIRTSYPKLRDEVLAELEQKLQVRLPQQYKEFLRKYNGGKPVPNVFAIKGNPYDSRGMIQHFLGVSEGNYRDILKQATVFRDRVPSDLLPVARDPGGSLICLAVSGENYGKIYFWDREDEVEEGEEPDYRNVYFIANSFDELLENLTTL